MVPIAVICCIIHIKSLIYTHEQEVACERILCLMTNLLSAPKN